MIILKKGILVFQYAFIFYQKNDIIYSIVKTGAING